MITGATRLAGVIGDPVRHSRSPVIHNAGYAALGLDWVYVALPVPAGHAFEAVRALPLLGIEGVNVTMPHKSDAATACDVLDADAAALGAVNTVLARADGLHGHSTDGEGFLLSVADAGLDPSGMSVLVLGAGGAARAVVLALGRRGASVMVAARRPEAASAAASLAPGARAHGFEDLDAVVADHEVIINATPLGMEDRGGSPPVPGPGQWAVDLVYHPADTAFLAVARARGAATVGGLGMLVHQAALSFELITGIAAPLEALRAAAAPDPAASQ